VVTSWTDCRNSFERKLENFQPFRVSGFLAVRGNRVRQIESGHRTDALGELANKTPLIMKPEGLRTMLTKGIKCERSKSYALV
jgi:hypothetical protein